MVKVILVAVSLIIGFATGWALHTQPTGFDYQRAISSGGLTRD